MLTLEEIKNLVEKYEIRDTEVYNRETGEKVVDEDTILRVKSAHLIDKETTKKFNTESFIRRDPTRNRDNCMKLTMDEFSCNGEKQLFGINHIIRSLMKCGGTYVEFVECSSLEDSNYAIFLGENADLGLAYLRFKMRSIGRDFEEFKITLDNNGWKKAGDFSRVIITFKPLRLSQGPIQENSDEINVPKDTNNESKPQENAQEPSLKEEPKTSAEEDSGLKYAREQLKLAENAQDELMIEYWSKIIRGDYESLGKNNTTAEEILNFERKPLQVRSAQVETPIQSREESSLSEIQEKKDNAGLQGDTEEAEYWQAVKDAISEEEFTKMTTEENLSKPVEPISSIPTPEPMNSTVDITSENTSNRINSIEDYERALNSVNVLHDKGNTEGLKKLLAIIKETKSNPDFQEYSNLWNSLSVEERDHLAQIQMRASSLLKDEESLNYWSGIHDSLSFLATIKKL